jgi:cytochrome c biogenesis protein CcmG, thiol:disulfide interchange protein DsbE
VLQRFADRAGGRVHVVGVVTQDTRARAAVFATDARVTFPALFDQDGQLLARVPAVGLPATLFVDRDGQVRHLHNAKLDEATLERFAEEHLDVGLP